MKRKFNQALACLALVVALSFGIYMAVILLRLRPQHVTLSAEPLAIRDDSKALELARKVMREAGYRPEDFGTGSSSYDSAFPDFRRYNFYATAEHSNHPGFHVRLEQDGSSVQATIARRK